MRNTQRRMLHLKRSPLTSTPAAAYRADMDGRTDAFGPDDDRWLAAASALHHAATAPRSGGKAALIEALTRAADIYDDAEVERLARTEWDGRPSKYDAIMVLADRIHYAGALHLAARMLDDLAAAPITLKPIHQGRLLALRARVEWKLGRLDEAIDRYRYIESLGATHDEPELLVRSLQGTSTIAQIRGNVPEFHQRSERSIRIAEEHGLTVLARRAHAGLTVTFAKRGQFDAALVSAWRAFELSGDDPELQAEALQNLGQLMLVSGHLALARSSFAAIVARPVVARMLIPALGGLASVSARLGAEPTVEWAVREIWRAQSESVPRYELTEALIEAAGALRTLGRREEAERYRQAGLQLAESAGFHELAFVAGQPADEPTVAAAPLGAAAAAIGERVAALEPPRLPKRVRFDRARV